MGGQWEIRTAGALRNARMYRAILVSILALTMLAMLVGCSGGSSSSAGTGQSTASETAAPPAVELDEAVEFGGISFQIPKGWVAVKADNGGMYYYPSDSDHTSIIHVLESDLSVAKGQEEKAFSDILGGVLGTENTKPEDLKSEDYTVDGYPAQRVTYTGTLGGSPFSLHFVCILHDGKASMLMGGSPSPEASYDAAFAACIDSIHVVDSGSASAVAEESSVAEEPEVEAVPTLGSTIEFDGLEIAFGKEYRTTTIDNQFSDYAGETIIEVPIALTNNSGETKGLNMFYIKVFGPKGTELDNVTAYFQDSDVSWAGEMRNGASMETAFHFPYEGDGTYYIALDKFNEKLEVEIPIQL